MNVWTGLYNGPLTFGEKEKELQRANDGEPSRKKRRTGKKSLKSIDKRHEFKQKTPRLTYSSVYQYLGEEPVPSGQPKAYFDRMGIYKLLFHLPSDDENVKYDSSWNKPQYRHGLAIVKKWLTCDEWRRFDNRLFKLFKRYCLCIPLASKDRWIAVSGKIRTKPVWIAFTEEGYIHGAPEWVWREGKSLDDIWKAEGSWDEEEDIRQNPDWSLSVKELLKEN